MRTISATRCAGRTAPAPNNPSIGALILSGETGTRAMRSGEMQHDVEKDDRLYLRDQANKRSATHTRGRVY
jgi:hypothetical protein